MPIFDDDDFVEVDTSAAVKPKEEIAFADPKDYLTTEEVAAILNIKVTTVYSYCVRGILHPIKLGISPKNYYAKDAVAEVVQRQSKKGKISMPVARTLAK